MLIIYQIFDKVKYEILHILKLNLDIKGVDIMKLFKSLILTLL